MSLRNRDDLVRKFKQGRVIDLLKDVFDEENYKIIKGGFCYMLSMEWVHLFVNNMTKCSEYDIVDNDTVLLTKDLAYYKQISMNFIEYCKLIDGANKIICINELQNDSTLAPDVYANFDKELGELCSNDKIKFTNFYDILNNNNFIVNVKNIKEYALFKFNWRENDIRMGHMTAFIKVDGILYFFDPNYGIFKVYSPDMEVSEEDTLKTLFEDIKETYNKGNEFSYGQLSYN